MSDVTGPHSLTGPERAIDSAYIHVTVPDGTVGAQVNLGLDGSLGDDPVSGDGDASGPRHAAIAANVGDGVLPTVLAVGDGVSPAAFAVADGARFAPGPETGFAVEARNGFVVQDGFAAEDGFAVGDGFDLGMGLHEPPGLVPEAGVGAPHGYDVAGPPPVADPTPPPFAAYSDSDYTGPDYTDPEFAGALVPTGPHPLVPVPGTSPPAEPPSPPGPYIPMVLRSDTEPPDPLEQRTPPGGWEDQRFPGIGRGDMLELAGRLEQLDQLLSRLEEAKRQAADASEHLVLTRRWQEETVRTIQEERARMRQRQHALDELAERARAAVEAMQALHRTPPREVVELAIELQVLDRAGFITRRAPRQRPEDQP